MRDSRTNRSEIHDVYGGQRQGDISTPRSARLIFLFSGETVVYVLSGLIQALADDDTSRSYRGHLLELAKSPRLPFQRGEKVVGPVLDIFM